MAVRMPGVRSGIDGRRRRAARCGATPRCRARTRGSRRTRRGARRRSARRVRGPPRRAGPRSPGGSACRSYEVVAAEDRGVPASIVGRRGRAHAAVPRRARRRPHRAPPRRSARARPTCGALPITSWVPTTPTTSPRTPSCGRGRRCPPSGATPAPGPGSSRSPAGRAPTRCGATCAAGAWPRRLEQRAALPGGPRSAVDPSDAHAVSALVDELPDDQRAAFVLTQVVGCSYEEAAEACGVPIGTIRSRVARAARAPRRRGAPVGDRMTRRALARVRCLAALVVGDRRRHRDPGRRARARRARAPPTTRRCCSRVTPARRRAARDASPTSARRSSSPTTGRATVTRARLRRRAVPAGRTARRVREHALSRDLPQPLDHHHRGAAEVGRRAGGAACGAACRPGTTASWHDHRAHFMGGDDPPQCRARPRQRRVVDNWKIPMRVGNRGRHRPRAARLRAAAVAVAVGRRRGAARRARRWCCPAPARGARCSWSRWRLLTLTEIVHVVGLWDASTASFGTKLGESAYSLAGIALGLLAPGLDLAQGRGVGGAARARRHHLPVRRRRPRRRHQPRQLAGPEHVLGRLRPAAGDAHPRARRRARGGGGAAAPTVVAGHAPAGTPTRDRPRPSPVELGAPRVVVGLHLDGGVRDVVLEQEHARLVEHAVRVGVGTRPSRARWRRPSPT